jgi:antitoxin (DNA-binding transcriptional repressor) of toxin-antitoxin stability system
MKSINVTELEAHLSRYLRMASRGSRMRDRNQPLAVLGPMEREAPSWRERLEGDGRSSSSREPRSRLLRAITVSV